MACVFGIASLFPRPSPSALFLPVMLTLPLAFLGACIERRHRAWQVAGYNRVIRRFRTGRDLEGPAVFSIWMSLFQLFCATFILLFLSIFLTAFSFQSVIQWNGAPLYLPYFSWPLLWTFGALGAVIALRIRRSYAVFIMGCVVVGVLSFWGVFI